MHRVTGWHTALSVLLTLTACSQSRDLDDGGASRDADVRDVGPDGPSPCNTVPQPQCRRGRCCEEAALPTLSPSCTWQCPSGFEVMCEVDPAALCEPETSCEDNDECALVDATCCGTCSIPELADVVGVHVDDVDEHRRAVCGDDPPACPPCAPPGPNPYLVAFCAIGREDGGRCLAVDLRDQAVTACSVDADCRVRARDCCECGADTRFDNLLAVASRGDYERFACNRDATCGGCAPIYPEEVEAFCDDGTCALRNLAAPTPFP